MPTAPSISPSSDPIAMPDKFSDFASEFAPLAEIEPNETSFHELLAMVSEDQAIEHVLDTVRAENDPNLGLDTLTYLLEHHPHTANEFAIEVLSLNTTAAKLIIEQYHHKIGVSSEEGDAFALECLKYETVAAKEALARYLSPNNHLLENYFVEKRFALVLKSLEIESCTAKEIAFTIIDGYLKNEYGDP